jgi:PTS system mannose-specific IIA component
MVAVILISHGSLAIGMREAAELLLGEQENVAALALLPGDTLEGFSEKLEKAIDSCGDPKNVLVLSDISSGTTSNAANMMALKKGIRHLSGANLAMVTAVLGSRQDEGMDSLTALALESARDGIIDSKELLEKIGR